MVARGGEAIVFHQGESQGNRTRATMKAPYKYRFFAGPASQAEGEHVLDMCSNAFSGGFRGSLSKKPILVSHPNHARPYETTPLPPSFQKNLHHGRCKRPHPSSPPRPPLRDHS